MLGTEPNTLTSKKLASTLYILRPENKIIEELLTLPALFPLSAECRTEEKKFCLNLKKRFSNLITITSRKIHFVIDDNFENESL